MKKLKSKGQKASEANIEVAKRSEDEKYNGLIEIAHRNKFYHDNYRSLVALLIIMIFVIAALVGVNYYIYKTRPTPKYFATTTDGKLIQLTPLNQPGLSINQLLTWTVQAVTAAYTFDFVNYQSQLQNVRNYFTKAGYDNFLKALQDSNNLNAVRAKKLVVSGVPTGAPVVLQEGLIGERYAWRVQLPMRIGFQSANETLNQDLIITMLITRVSTLESEKGVGIAQFVAVSK